MTDIAPPRATRVTREQVSAARNLIRLRGGEDQVDADIRALARATPMTRAEEQAEYEQELREARARVQARARQERSAS